MLCTELSKHLALGQPYALVDFPAYGNVGDSAIWLGAARLLKTVSGRAPDYVCSNRNPQFERLSKVDGPIFISGGGNFGDLYKVHQAFRESLMAECRQAIIQLPQSIHFADPVNFSRCAEAIRQHGNVHIIVRDRQSLERAQFDCPVSLTPDCAIALDLTSTHSPTHDHVSLLRGTGDRERSSQHADLAQSGPVFDWVASSPWFRALYKLVRATHSHLFYDVVARHRLAFGVRLLSQGRRVTTDRLHGYIIAALLGIPVTPLDNSYGKVSNYHRDWPLQ